VKNNIADHFITAINIKSVKRQVYFANKYIKILSQKAIDSYIKDYNWSKLIEEKDCVTLYEKIKSLFNKFYQSSSKTIVQKPNTRPYAINEWVNSELLGHINKRDELYKKWKSTPTNKTYEKEYKKTRNIVNKLIKKDKSNFYKNKFKNCFNDTKKTWDEINHILGRKTKNDCDETITRYMLKDRTEDSVSNDFVNYFSDSISNMLHKCNHKASNIVLEELPHSLYIPRATLTDIENIVKKMKNSKSTGIDNIRMFDLKRNIKTLGPIITRLINMIIKQAKIPQDFKCSITRPIFKGGKHIEFGN